MVKVDESARIRQAHRLDKLSVRELARRFRHSRRKIREILAQPEPKPYRRRPMPSVVDPFKPIIDDILDGDLTAPRKQRHTMAKLFRRLRDEHGYPGSYERVRQYVLGRDRRHRETFIPLDHAAGQRLEADFGHIHADIREGQRNAGARNDCDKARLHPKAPVRCLGCHRAGQIRPPVSACKLGHPCVLVPGL